MNNIRFLIAISLCAINYPLAAQNDCLSNSYNLTEYDNKTYHHEECNCPCDAYRAKGLGCADRNKCIECGHFHDARPQYVVNTKAPIESKEITPVTLQTLINRYKQRKALNTPIKRSS